MSLLSNILGALIPAPAAPTLISGDAVGTGNNDFTGAILKNDNVIFDATKNLDEKFGNGGDKVQDYSCLDGGLGGFDTLTIKLTESQYAAFQAESAAKIGAIKAGGIDFNDISTIFKIATGQQAVKFDSIGVELKGWECIKFDICKDPNVGPVATKEIVSVTEDHGLFNGTLLDNASDADGKLDKSDLKFALVADKPVPAGLHLNENGTYTFDTSDPAYQYLNNGESKTLSIDYTVTDAKGATATATMCITVHGTDEKPVCVPHAGAALFTENFDSYANLDASNPWAWSPVDLSTHGWTNAGHATEVAVKGYAGVMETTSGNYWLDTQATTGAINISHTFNDPTGGKVTVGFDIATEDFTAAHGATAANATFDVLVDDHVIGHLTAAQIRAAAGGDNKMAHFDFMADTGAAGQHTLTLKDTTPDADASNYGFAIDSVQIRDFIPMHQGSELVQNWNFEQDNADNANGFVDLNSISGWNNEAGTTVPMQVQHEKFAAFAGFAAGEHQWLDTSASPGNIKIGQDLDVGTGKSATLSVSVAAEDIRYNNGSSTDTYRPDADDHLLFKFNGQVVKDIKLADFTDAQGHVDWNHFKDFSVDVTGQAGTDHLTIESTGMDQHTDADGVIHGYAGFAVDHVSLKEWTPCAQDGKLAAEWTFENHTAANGDEIGSPTGFWDLNQWAHDHPGVYGADADTFGFTSGMQVHGEDGHRALDTAGSPGNIFLQAIPTGRGGPDATMPDLVAGKEYHATVSILKQDYSGDAAAVAAGHEGTDPDAWVEFNFNGNVLAVHASDIQVSNEFVTFDMTFKGVEGEDGFTIQSHGTHDDAQGLLIDNIAIHEWNALGTV